MLGLASLVAALRDDPGSVGKRYQLTANLDPSALPAVRAIPGVADAGTRYVVRGADSFALGEPVELLAFDGDHTRFEDPPLASGRRVRADDEAEIGVGLAQALGIGRGATLAVQLPSRRRGAVPRRRDGPRARPGRARRVRAAAPDPRRRPGRGAADRRSG